MIPRCNCTVVLGTIGHIELFSYFLEDFLESLEESFLSDFLSLAELESLEDFLESLEPLLFLSLAELESLEDFLESFLESFSFFLASTTKEAIFKVIAEPLPRPTESIAAEAVSKLSIATSNALETLSSLEPSLASEESEEDSLESFFLRASLSSSAELESELEEEESFFLRASLSSAELLSEESFSESFFLRASFMSEAELLSEEDSLESFFLRASLSSAIAESHMQESMSLPHLLHFLALASFSSDANLY